MNWKMTNQFSAVYICTPLVQIHSAISVEKNSENTGLLQNETLLTRGRFIVAEVTSASELRTTVDGKRTGNSKYCEWVVVSKRWTI